MLACDQCICTFESFLSLFFREDDVWGFVFKKKKPEQFLFIFIYVSWESFWVQNPVLGLLANQTCLTRKF